MAKRIYFIVMMIALGLNCSSLMAQSEIWQTPEIISIGKEASRSEIIPYDTKDGALSLSRSSKYVDILLDDWVMQEASTYVEYSVKFKRPFLWVNRAVMLNIEGVTHAYEVFVNGVSVGYNQSSITAAEFNITAIATTGANELTIKVFKGAISNAIGYRSDEQTTPSIGRVYVSSPPKVMIRDFTVNTSVTGEQSGIMQLGVVLKSQLLNNRDVKLFYELYSPEGEVVSRGSRDANLDMKREDTIRFLINVPDARLWSHETPNLYTIILSTQHEGRFTEYVNIKSGFRTITVDGDRLSINGNEVKLAIKEYFAPKDSLQLHTELVEIKNMGYNMIKVKSHPHRSMLYELCDRIGLYVCDQADINTSSMGSSIAIKGNASNDPIWEGSFVDRVLSMYHSSKNYPSVIMFSMAENSANGYNLYESYIALKKLEKVRPIVYVGAGGEWNSDAVDVDEIGVNRHNRLRLGEHEQRVVPKDIVTITDVDPSKGVFTIKNNYSLTPIYVNATYVVKRRRKIESEGTIPLSISANSTKNFEIPFGGMSLGEKLKVKVSIVRKRVISTNFVKLPADSSEVDNRVLYINMFKDKGIDNSIEELYLKEYEVVSTK